MSHKEDIKVEVIERDFVNVDFKIIDVAPPILKYLSELLDVTVDNPLDEQLLQYNETTGKWENKTFTSIVNDRTVFNELPTQLTPTLFQTGNDFIPGKLQVFVNGIKERFFTEVGSNQFQLGEDTVVGDIIEVNYIKTM